MKSYSLDASYALESRWLTLAKCNESPPDIIYNSTTMDTKDQTIWFQLTDGSSRICASTFLDCANSGVCLSSLDTEASYYSSSMIYMFPNPDHNYTSGVYGLPSKTKGHTYCSIMSEFDTHLLLTGPDYTTTCHGIYDKEGTSIAGFSCTPDLFLVYDNETCSGDYIANYSASFEPTPIDGFDNYSYMFQTFGSESSTTITWTKYYPGYLSVPIGSYLGIFAFFMIFAILLPSLSTINMAIKWYKDRKPKYYWYALCFCAWIVYFCIWTFQVCHVFLDSEQLAVTAEFMGLLYMMASGMTVFMNSYIVYVVILRKNVIKCLFIGTIFALYLGLAGPYLFKYIFYSPNYASDTAVAALYAYWVKPTDGYWQIFSLAYEPSCVVLTTLYISKTLRLHSLSPYRIFFSNRVVTIVFAVVNLNFLVLIILKSLENYSLIFGNDYSVFVLYSFYHVQYSINAISISFLVEQIPSLMDLIRMANEGGEGVRLKDLKKRLNATSALKKSNMMLNERRPTSQPLLSPTQVQPSINMGQYEESIRNLTTENRSDDDIREEGE